MAGLAVALWGADSARVTSVVRPDAKTGRLVRRFVVHMPAAPALARAALLAPDRSLDEAVARIAAQNDLPAPLIQSVIAVESNFNPFAVSPKGALGMMQLVPDTARRFGVRDVFDPVENIEGGARYLKYLLGLFDGNYPLALAAYNAGEGAVFRYGGVPPYPETQSYVKQVSRKLEKARRTAPAAAKPAAPPAHNPIREELGPDGKIYYTSR